MRDDAIGMFWEDVPAVRGKGRIAAVMPDIPETGWQMPQYLPDLSASSIISIDTETFDPELIEKGPGWARGKGHIVGISIGDDKGGAWYFPIRHEIFPEENWDPEVVLNWLRKQLSNPLQPKVGANLLYDLGWLKHEGVEVAGDLYDVQYAEALLHEARTVALEDLGQRYLGMGKESNTLYQWCADYYGGNPNGKQRANIYRTPARLTGYYAESDAYLPIKILEKQWPLLVEEGLMDLFIMECELMPLYLAMRFAGVTVNIPYAEELRDTLEKKELEVQKNFEKQLGFGINVNATDSLVKIFDSFGLSYPTTAKGNPSFTKQFLEGLDNPAGVVINEIRQLQKLRGTFVESYILDSHVNGKVYGQFHPLRGEGGGTRSGRYSSSTPNLQNIPSRDPVLAPMIRGLFIPDVGHCAWRKYDYSQIEYRFMVHFAVGQAGNRARAMFNANPDLDYHDFAQQLIKDKLGIHIDRKPIKNINFGLIYGMGQATLSKNLGLTKKAGNELFEAYFEAVDFAKPTMEQAMAEAQDSGIIKTIMGRKSRFDLWESANWDRNSVGLPLEKALVTYAKIRRAYTHKALNRKLQGSAADQMKKAMHKCWKDGVFDATGVPRLTVHDELDFSDPGGRDEAFLEMQHVMETALPLSIPVKADGEIGPDWGHVTDLDKAIAYAKETGDYSLFRA
jgi:DNA polymerase I-like protein with 3'-5' exonuclease and polymerase domains